MGYEREHPVNPWREHGRWTPDKVRLEEAVHRVAESKWREGREGEWHRCRSAFCGGQERLFRRDGEEVALRSGRVGYEAVCAVLWGGEAVFVSSEPGGAARFGVTAGFGVLLWSSGRLSKGDR